MLWPLDTRARIIKCTQIVIPAIIWTIAVRIATAEMLPQPVVIRVIPVLRGTSVTAAPAAHIETKSQLRII